MRLIIAAFLCLLPTVGWSDDISAASKVVAAKMFPAGAIVTRQARISVPAGAHRIVIPDMPGNLAVDTLQVGFGQPAGPLVRAMNFSARPVPLAPVKTPRMIAAERDLQQAEAALNVLGEQRAVIRGALDSAKLRITFLNALAEGGKPPLSGDGGLAAGDLAALIGEAGTQMAQATQDATAAGAALDATARQLAELQEAVKRAQAALEAVTPLRRDTGTLVLDLAAETAFDGGLYLSYAEADAGWQPSYEVDLQQDAGKGALRLIRQAVVRQQTREDWADVAVTLSTAALGQPTQVTIPQSTIYWLRDKDEIMPLAKSSAGQAESRLLMAPMPEMAADDAFAGATTALRGQTLEFEMGQAALVGGDGSEQLFRLDVIARDVALYALANARRDSFAYLYTDLKNETGGTLLAGPAAIYRDGTLVGHTQVPQTANGDITKLPLGALNGLQLEHRVLNIEAGDSRFITAKTTRDEGFEVLIDSYLDYAIDLTVYEALPVPEDEDLDIRLETVPSPTEQSVEGRRGVVGWTRSIAAGASQKITYGWTLRWPEDRELMQR